MKKTALFLIMCCSGCSTVSWVKPGGSAAELNQDHYHCEREAVGMYPPLMVPHYSIGSAHHSPAKTNCRTSKGDISCSHIPGTYTRQVLNMEDANKDNRISAVWSCLRSRGYEYVRQQ